MDAVEFLHLENPPTWAGVEPANLGVQGQRQTNYAPFPQSAISEAYLKTFGLSYVHQFRMGRWEYLRASELDAKPHLFQKTKDCYIDSPGEKIRNANCVCATKEKSRESIFRSAKNQPSRIP
ncbi:hypothetical protein TNCV_1568471 [Trichonephila clavipes]|nr:hypothetical protein TNCV_1568471 [Trichonephila clavipes]